LSVGLLAGARAVFWPRLEPHWAEWRFNREAFAWHRLASAWAEPPNKLKWSTAKVDFDAMHVYYLPRMAVAPAFDLDERQILLDSTGRQRWANSPMLFMHSRTTAAGLTQLVCVGKPQRSGEGAIVVPISILTPSNGRIVEVLRGGASIDFAPCGDVEQLRLFAGQPDPNDASRFTIPFESHGRPGVIDGVFESSTDPSVDASTASSGRVRLTLRVPSATPSTNAP
jgi:hypothetical protein